MELNLNKDCSKAHLCLVLKASHTVTVTVVACTAMQTKILGMLSYSRICYVDYPSDARLEDLDKVRAMDDYEDKGAGK